ncbi:hypothetical protein BX600DRAFT_146881 [Xylariales sp. PMI_506]|nr:hypothetical protein BX600DRAFT_146881 [Xylariales sp. PMI_506]
MYRRACARLSWAGIFLVGITEIAAFRHELYPIHQLQKDDRALHRRDYTCEADWSLCPDSDGGGCCPDNYACASTYCYATTAGPTSACGRSGYYNCPSPNAGSCCPVGYICGDQCTPPAGTTQTCSASYFACPSSLGYGCCPNGMACGIGACYSTNPSTAVVTIPVTTTNSAGSRITSVVTETTVITPSIITTSTGAGAIPKLVASTISKEAAIETNSSSGNSGLTQPQLGGIIGGVCVLLIAIIVAAIIIVRRLKKTAEVVESKRGSSAENQTRASTKPGFGPPTVTEIDVNDIDPLMQTPSIRPSHLLSRPELADVDLQQPSPARSPPLGPNQFVPPTWSGQYNLVPSGGESSPRHPSIDSTTRGYYDPAIYPQPPQSAGDRTSYDSQATAPATATSRHGRWSNASEVSGSADGAHGFSELEALGDGGHRRSGSGATRPAAAHIRRNSDGHQRGLSDSSPVQAALLDTVTEVGELHGYYGPVNQQIGQTAARPESQPPSPDR